MDIKYLLLFLMHLKIFVCSLFINSFVQVLSAMYYLLIMHVNSLHI